LAAIEHAADRQVGDTVGNATHDLYRRYGKQIYAYCFHRLRSKEEAEDAVQTTFMNAFRSLQRGASTQFEQAWLFKIAQNVCIARQTSSSRRLRLEAPNDFEVLQEIVPGREGEGSLELIGIEDALEGMPENQRRAILLREWQGLSYREIGAELQLTQPAVEMLIFRARRALAGALEQPEQARSKTGRKIGSLGSILGVLKTLLGGGAAVKAAAVAAAAIAVIGEGASHTIVSHKAPAIGAAAQVAAVAAKAPRASAARMAFSASEQVSVVRPVGAAVEHHSAAKARHARRVATPAPEPAASEPAAPEPTVGPAPAPGPASPAAAPAPAPGPAPAPAPAPAAPTAAPAQPTHGDDKKEKDKSRDIASVPAPVQAAPATTTTTTTAAVPISPLPAAVDPQPEHGNDDEHGHKGKDKDIQPLVTVPATTVPTPAPTPVVNGKEKDKQKGP
jgi:RNA polymerase sigma factor (sigma-70 family)